MLKIVFEIVLNKFKGIDQIERQHFDFKISKIYMFTANWVCYKLMPFRNKPSECLCVFFCSTWVFSSKILYSSWAELEQEQNEYIQPQSLWEAILLFHCVCASRKKLLFHSISYVPPTSDSCLFLRRIMECGNAEIRLIRAFQNWTPALWEWPRWQSSSPFCVGWLFVGFSSSGIWI